MPRGIKMTPSKKGLLIAIFGLFIVGGWVTFGSYSNAYIYIKKITEKISDKNHQKYKYLYEHFEPKVSKDDIYIFDMKQVSIIRIQNKSYCDDVWCLTYVILKCNKKRCPTGSALAGSNFYSADYMDSRFGYPIARLIFSGEHEGIEGYVTFLLDRDFVTVQGSYQKIENKRK